MAIGDRRFMGLVVAIVFLCIGVAVLGWANYSLGTSSDKRYAAIARRVDDLSRANGIKDQQLQQAGIAPSPLLGPFPTTTTTTEAKRTTATERSSTTVRPAASTTTAATAPPTTSAPPTTVAPTTTSTAPSTTTTTTRPCIVPVTIRPGGCP